MPCYDSNQKVVPCPPAGSKGTGITYGSAEYSISAEDNPSNLGGFSESVGAMSSEFAKTAMEFSAVKKITDVSKGVITKKIPKKL